MKLPKPIQLTAGQMWKFNKFVIVSTEYEDETPSYELFERRGNKLGKVVTETDNFEEILKRLQTES